MPTSYTMLVYPESFDTSSGTLNFEVFTSKGSVILQSIPEMIVAGAQQHGGSIALPNGAKYDPYQTYDAPITPGTATVRLVLKPYSGATAFNSQDLIEGYYSSDISDYVGKRGTIYGVAHSFYAETTARLMAARISLFSNYPQRRRTDGSDVPGITAATIDLDFDLLTNWTLTGG